MPSTLRTMVVTLLASALVGCGGGGSGTEAVRVTGGNTTGTGTAVTGSPIAFTSAAGTDSSLIITPHVELLNDMPALSQLWSRHGSRAPLPTVDFATESLIAVFRGDRPVLGWQTEIVRVERSTGGDYGVTVRDFGPGDWVPSPSALSQPWEMVRIAKATPGARVTLREQQRLDREVIDAGSQSAIGQGDPTYQGELLLFTDAPGFQAFWALHDPATRPPAVNFNGESVIAVLAGFIGRFGNRVETLHTVYDPTDDTVRIDYVVHPYRGGAAPPQITETPFQILRVSKVPASAQVRAELRQSLPAVERNRGTQAQSATTQKEVIVVRDQAALDQVIATRIGSRNLNGAPPVVDFAVDQVIVVLAGEKTTLGNAISVARVEMFEDGELDVLVHHSASLRPQSGRESPFQLVTVPRTEGPVFVRFQDTTPVP